jgi:hypothetical protein
LIVTLLISASSLVPGAIDARLSDDLTREARKQLGPETTVHAHVAGDPVLQLPWGVVPHLTADVAHLETHGLPISLIHVELDDVRVGAWTLLAHQPPHLLAPAPARVEVRLTRTDLQAILDKAVEKLKPADFALDLPLLGHVQPRVSDVRVNLADNRFAVSGQVRLKEGAAPRTFSASIALGVAGGDRIVATDPRVALGTQAIPSFLLGSLIKGPVTLVHLADLGLPAGKWTMDAPAIEPDGLAVRVHGTLEDFRP